MKYSIKLENSPETPYSVKEDNYSSVSEAPYNKVFCNDILPNIYGAFTEVFGMYPLIKLLDYENTDEIRHAAHDALEMLDSFELNDKIKEILLGESFSGDYDDYDILLLFEKINDPHLFDIIEQILQHSKSENDRILVTKALKNYKDPRAVSLLIGALHDESPYVKGNAALALGEIGDKAAVIPLIAAYENNEYKNYVAIVALGNIGDPRAVESILNLLETDNNQDIWSSAVEALGKIGDKRAVPTIIKYTERIYNRIFKGEKTNENYQYLNIAVKALRNIGDPRAFHILCQTSDIVKYNICKNSLDYLGMINHPGTINYLADYLTKSIGYSEKKAAEEALSNAINHCQFMQPILSIKDDLYSQYKTEIKHSLLEYTKNCNNIDSLSVLLKNQDWKVQVEAIRAIVELNDTIAKTFLVDLFDDENPKLRIEAAKALINFDSSSTTPYLIRLLSDKDKDVRKYSALELSKQEDIQIVEILLYILEECSYKYYTSDIYDVLNNIIDQDYNKPKKWKKWLKKYMKQNNIEPLQDLYKYCE